MSDDGADEDQEEQKKFFADRAKTGRSTCKKCKVKLDSGSLRIAKSGYNPFGPFPMKMWHHVTCLFDVFSRQRPTTAKIETPDDIDGWSDLEEEDQQDILKFLPNCKGWTPKPKTPTKDDGHSKMKPTKTPTDKAKKDSPATTKEPQKDDSFREFRRLCAALSDTDSYTGKTALVKEFFTKGTDGSSFKGDLHLWCRLLLPGVVKRVYNLQSKQLIKLFSKIFHTNQDDMLEDLEQGDIAETVRVFFEKSRHLQPTKKSALYLQDIDKFLEELSGMTKEDDQTHHFKQMVKKCTSNDLKMIIRLVKHDLRINAGPKHILEAVHPDAYQAFQTSRDLDAVLSKAVVKTGDGHSSPSKRTSLKIAASVMTPVLPMLPKSNGDHNKGKNEAESTYTSEKRSIASNNNVDSPSTKKRRITSDNSENETEETAMKQKRASYESDDVDQEEDEYSIFANYVAHEIRSMRSEENRRYLKRIIQKAIIDMAELDDGITPSEPTLTSCNNDSALILGESLVTSQERSGD